ncbi:redox-sensing transcriptional repressor Rex [bacterium]|nr:redox-sensing transcriptional repressor Rex [candidate division CSSED10-310 bacterium]
MEITVGRLSLYRRILNELSLRKIAHVYSHNLAAKAGITAAAVRRDMMVIGFSGSPSKGYNVDDLVRHISGLIDHPDGQKIALIGVGNLGRALISFFHGHRPKLTIEAAFDIDEGKVNRVVSGCRAYPLERLEAIIDEQGITAAVIAVPAAAAQDIARRLVKAGVTGILNFAPVPLQVPPDVYTEDIDITMAMEKVAYFTRQHHTKRGEA